MTKSNGLDVSILCFGDIRGCRVNHCNLAASCLIITKSIEQFQENIRENLNQKV